MKEESTSSDEEKNKKASENIIEHKEAKAEVSEELYESLKEYRLSRARAEYIKSFFIFNNNTLEEHK